VTQQEVIFTLSFGEIAARNGGIYTLSFGEIA
jgi:hypothetical protein